MKKTSKRCLPPVAAVNKVEICQHTDGRFWLRVDGKLVLDRTAVEYETKASAFAKHDGRVIKHEVQGRELPALRILVLAAALESRLEVSAKESLDLLTGAPLLVFSHPNFVQPYQWAK